MIISALTGLLLGALIGAAFGWLQLLALRRNQRRQQLGGEGQSLATVPGSMSRVAFLLMALALAQVVFPWLFPDQNKWWVTAGVLGSYGWMLYLQLKQRIARNK